MTDSLYGQQLPEHDAASDDAPEQHLHLRSDSLHHPSPPTLSFNQNGLPSPFTWEQAYTDHIHSSTNFSQPTCVSAPLYDEMGNAIAALTHDHNYRDGAAAQRSFPSSYDLPLTSEALRSTSYADLMAIATTSSADDQGIDPQHQAPARTHHLSALSINVEWSSPGHDDAAAGLVSHPESAPSVTGARDMVYNTETSLQSEYMHHLPSDVVHTNPMSDILNIFDVPSAGLGSPFDMLLMSGTTGNALHLETHRSSPGMGAVNSECDFQLPGKAIFAHFSQNTHALPAIVPSQAFNAQDTPVLADEPRASSGSFAQGESGPSRKRSRSDDDGASQSPRPSVDLPAGMQRIACKWQQVFGGGCVRTFCGTQQHDRHVLSHLPDTDGTVFFSYMCKICPPNKDEEMMRAAIKRWGKKEERGFSRDDSCRRHVNAKHAEELKGDNPKEHMFEVSRPWWWPSELMMTERHKGKEIGRKPEGETRTWKAYFQDIIDKYPGVVERPNRPSLDDENENDSAGHTRPVKRRRTRKSTTS